MLSDEQIERERFLQKLSPEDMLEELLATIHGDGGHYSDEHGLAKAVADAEAKWYSALSQSTEQGERDAFEEFAAFVTEHNAGKPVPWPIAEMFVRAYRAAMSPHGDGVNYTRAEGGEDGVSRLRFDVLQEIAQTFGLDYNAVCRCANAYLAGVNASQEGQQ